MYSFYMGDNSDKENAEIRVKLKQIPENESLILVATGQKIGEGFDFPRLDVLMLAALVSFEGRLEQYVGRLNRDYVGKEAVYGNRQIMMRPDIKLPQPFASWSNSL